MRVRLVVATIAVLATLSMGGRSIATLAGEEQAKVLFGPERFERTKGAPDVFTRQFTVPSDVVGPFTLTVVNGQAGGTARVANTGAVTSGRITLNGAEVVSSSDFSSRMTRIERSIAARGLNVLEVTLASSPGSFITVTVTGFLQRVHMLRPRAGHTATLDGDGSVLIHGGETASGVDGSVERFDPATKTFRLEPGALLSPRAHHTTTVLADGRLMIAAGSDGVGGNPGNELFDSVSGLAALLPGGMQTWRSGHTATPLGDGRVLVVGGRDGDALGSTETFDAQAATLFKPAFDSAGGSFRSTTYRLAQPRSDHTATLLPDGRVLIAGGRDGSTVLSSVEIFDPALDEFVPLAGGMPEGRAGHTATLLPDGRVLLLGGRNASGYLASGVLFNPSTGTFSPASALLNTARAEHSATLLRNGQILIAGGEAGAGPLASSEPYAATNSDVTAPQATWHSPADGATGVDLTDVIGVRFSEPLDVSTLHGGSVRLAGVSPVDAHVVPSADGLLLYVLPTAPLAPNTPYALTLTGDITDTFGNALVPVTWTFTTVAAPAIHTFTPAEASVGSAVTIHGAGFDPDPTRNIVRFGGVDVTVTSATAGQIDTIVPAGLPVGDALVSVTTRGGTATAQFPVVPDVPEGPGPAIACLSPADGSTITGTPGASRSFQGTVDVTGGLSSFTVNGVATPVNAAGAFAATIVPAWGVNFVTLAATDASGRRAERTCAFLLSSGWVPDASVLPDTVSVRLGQAAVDDGSRADLDSFGDVLQAIVASPSLRAAVDAALQAANPLLPPTCHSEVLGVCIVRSDLLYLDMQIAGPSSVSATLVSGGFRVDTTIRDVRLRLRSRGQIAGVSFDTIGWITVSSMDVGATYNLLNSGGHPIALLRSGSVITNIGAVSIDFSGLDSQIVDVIATTFDNRIRDILVGQVRDFLVNNLDAGLDSILGSLSLDMPAGIDVPRLDAGTVHVNSTATVTSLSVLATRMLSGLGTRVWAAPTHARPTFGAPIVPGSRLFDSSAASAANAAHASLINQGLHALWRGGYFDVALGGGMLNGAVPAGVTITSAALMQPAAVLRDPQRLEISIGALAVTLTDPATLPAPVSGTLAGRVSCAVQFAGALSLGDCRVDSLHASFAMTSAQAAAAEPVLRAILLEMLTRAVKDGAPALPLATYSIESALGGYGLPVGTRFQVIVPALRRTGDHLVLEGAFGAR